MKIARLVAGLPGAVGTMAGALLVAISLPSTGCARHQIRDLPRDGAPENAVAWDTETVCGRPEAAAYSMLPLTSATWRDLAERADRRPVDASALRGMAQLMRANRERFADSVCTARGVAAVEESADRAQAGTVGSSWPLPPPPPAASGPETAPPATSSTATPAPSDPGPAGGQCAADADCEVVTDRCGDAQAIARRDRAKWDAGMRAYAEALRTRKRSPPSCDAPSTAAARAVCAFGHCIVATDR
jgi:hypothetical protein